MKTIFSDPMHWVAGAVGTKTRLILVLTALSVLIGYAVFEASSGRWHSARALTLLIIWLQFLLLYAMRATYLRMLALAADRHPVAGQP